MYHVMNTAFLLIESERDQYNSIIEKVGEGDAAARFVSARLILRIMEGWMERRVRWSFGVWFAIVREHKAWLHDNQMNSVVSDSKERQMRAAMKVIGRIRNACLVRCLNGWIEFIKEEKRVRVVLGRFVRRMELNGVNKCINQWKEYRLTRVRMRGFLKRMVGGRRFSLMGGGFAKWKDVVCNALSNDTLANLLAERDSTIDSLQTRLEQTLRTTEGAAIDIKNGKLKRTIHRMLGTAVSSGFFLWHKHISILRRREEVIQKAGRRWRMQVAVHCFNNWAQNARIRKWLRGIMRRMLGGKEDRMKSAAFRQMKLVYERLKEEGVSLEISQLQDENQQLQVRTRNRVLFDCVSPIERMHTKARSSGHRLVLDCVSLIARLSNTPPRP